MSATAMAFVEILEFEDAASARFNRLSGPFAFDQPYRLFALMIGIRTYRLLEGDWEPGVKKSAPADHSNQLFMYYGVEPGNEHVTHFSYEEVLDLRRKILTLPNGEVADDFVSSCFEAIIAYMHVFEERGTKTRLWMAFSDE